MGAAPGGMITQGDGVGANGRQFRIGQRSFGRQGHWCRAGYWQQTSAWQITDRAARRVRRQGVPYVDPDFTASWKIDAPARIHIREVPAADKSVWLIVSNKPDYADETVPWCEAGAGRIYRITVEVEFDRQQATNCPA